MSTFLDLKYTILYSFDTLIKGYSTFIKNVSSSTSHKKLRLYKNLRKFFLTLSFMNRV